MTDTRNAPDDTGPTRGADASGAVETAYRYIRNAIISGDLKSGETLQEAKLAKAIGLSRTPVREALSRLNNEGLVVLERYRRGQVASFSLADVAEIFRLRAKLEAHGARRAALRITPEQIAHLEAVEAEMEAHFDEVGWHRHLARFDELNNEFHATIARAADSPRLERILAASLELPASIFNTYAEPVDQRTQRTHRQHHEILSALRMRNPDWAEAAMAAHLFSILVDPAPDPEGW
ncbi:GntR family transcriptional regulator [Amorphus orientalis]|uniref:DNA-binding GntR family transcriptional regulator n=1 Tax=Amorphus orientalis TaxID=649198 RepID=A0AAE4ARC3_9HYPH|nr:GntR family transcriptional regulator [Amorphus orientalis]MDQ0315041.1 DNA-binding GntR family transcriptional regulator [Amorphus orientalis]